MVKPLYIDNICLGYFYIECDKKMALEQTTYSSTVGGIRPSGAYKGTYDFHRNASSEYTAIKNIADAISKKIDAKFVNTNQDLSKEIYSILKYNASVDATGKIAKITVSFIPQKILNIAILNLIKKLNAAYLDYSDHYFLLNFSLPCISLTHYSLLPEDLIKEYTM